LLGDVASPAPTAHGTAPLDVLWYLNIIGWNSLAHSSQLPMQCTVQTVHFIATLKDERIYEYVSVSSSKLIKIDKIFDGTGSAFTIFFQKNTHFKVRGGKTNPLLATALEWLRLTVKF